MLGLLQGLTEFLPVSSSGHLQAVPFLVGWEPGGLTFDVLVHLGTLVAVIWYFRADLWYLASRSLGIGSSPHQERRRARFLVLLLAVASVPTAVAGLLFADVFEAAFSSPRAIAMFLYVTAVVLWAAETVRARRLTVAQAGGRVSRDPATDDRHPHVASATEELAAPERRPDPAADDLDEAVADRVDHAAELAEAEREPPEASLADDLGRSTTSMGLKDAAAVGAAQALAIFPGISRSGATIAAGMLMGLSRSAAARFSFLLSIPVILGATVVTVLGADGPEPNTLGFGTIEIAAGMVAATLSGYWAIRTLLALVQRRSLKGFAVYVAIFGTILMAATFIG